MFSNIIRMYSKAIRSMKTDSRFSIGRVSSKKRARRGHVFADSFVPQICFPCLFYVFVFRFLHHFYPFLPPLSHCFAQLKQRRSNRRRSRRPDANLFSPNQLFCNLFLPLFIYFIIVSFVSFVRGIRSDIDFFIEFIIITI